MKRDLLTISDLTPDEVAWVVRRGRALKATPVSSALAGKSVALLFEKPSLRTRTSFQVAVQHLGGFSMFFGRDEVGLGGREPASDVARVLSRYVQCVVARVFSHAMLAEFARYASVPVINALSDWEHPCQALADVMTIDERLGTVKGATVTYIGDGNNNCTRSLAIAVASLGGNVRIASPAGYELDGESIALAQQRGAAHHVTVQQLRDPVAAARGADVLYTDVWTSMGQETEGALRRKAFAGYAVDKALLKVASRRAIVMHPMPVHYGEEMPAGMLEHPRAAAYDEAENRLHAQKAVFELLFSGR